MDEKRALDAFAALSQETRLRIVRLLVTAGPDGLPAGEIGVRHSKDSEGPVLRFTPDEWHAFVGGVRNGEFDSFGQV